MTTTERAADLAAILIRRGTSPALAVWKSAERYGLSTGEVSGGLRMRRRRVVRHAAAVTTTDNEWWNR